MAGSLSQDGGGPSEDFDIVAALNCVMPTHYLYAEMCDSNRTNELKIHPIWHDGKKNCLKMILLETGPSLNLSQI